MPIIEANKSDILNPRVPVAPAHLYAAHMASKKFPGQYFVVVKKQVDWHQSYFHGVGYWTDTHPNKEGASPPDHGEVKDAYIPWHNITFIENTQYRYHG